MPTLSAPFWTTICLRRSLSSKLVRPGSMTTPCTCLRAVLVFGRTSFDDNDLLKQMVVQNGALSVGMYYDDAFDSFDPYAPDPAATATYYCNVAAGEEHDGYAVGENHGVCIVGWDDTFASGRFTAAGAGAPPVSYTHL